MRLSLLLTLALLLVPTVSRAAGESPRIEFSPELKQWIAEHPKVRLGVDPAWPPFSFIGPDERHQGIDAEMLALVGERAGIAFELIPTRTWTETTANVLGRVVEVVPGAAETEERAKFVDFTQPYLSPPVAVIMRDDAPFWVGLRSLAGRRVAAARGYVTTAYLQREHPALSLVLVDDVGEALQRVSDRHADAVLANLVTATHVIRMRGLTNLKIVGVTDLHFDLRFAVQKGEPELLAILNQTIESIDQRERHAIMERWVAVNIEDAINWRLIRTVGGWSLLVLASVILASVLWNRRLQKEIAERRKIEADLRRHQTELETANAGLKTLNEDRRMLMNMLAHDLNGPLSVLSMSCDFLRNQIPREAKTAQRDIDGMQQATDRMVDLVRNLLDAESIEQGSRKLQIDCYPLGVIVAGVVEGLQRLALGKRMTLTFADATRGKGRARCDSGAVEQIAANLVTNALKFTPIGGTVRAFVEASDGTLRMAVEDTGPGIPAEERSQLFGKFARLTPQPTSAENSNGLGLAIVRLLARAMAGEVEYQECPGGGSRFVVTLPAVE